MEGIHSIRREFFVIAFLVYFNGIFAEVLRQGEENTPCIGKYQGPFLKTQFVMKDRWFNPMSCDLCDKQPDSVHLWNNVETIVTDFIYDDEKKQPIISRGPLEGKGKYRFRHMYFNWLSETPEQWAFNDIRFPAELHLVFYNTKHADYDIALAADEGIAILSMGFRVREHTSREFPQDIVDHLKYVNMSLANRSVNGTNLVLNNFLPKTLDFYHTYKGTMVSRTTPWGSTCTPNVIWIEFEESLKIKPEQVLIIQSLVDFYNIPLISVVPSVLQPRGVIYSSAKSYVPPVNDTVNNGQCDLVQFMANGFLLSALIFRTLFL